MNHDLAVFAPDSSRTFAERIAKELAVPLGRHEERWFEDGEHKTRPLVSVRGADVYVIASLYEDRIRTVNDKLCQLLFFVGALKDACASRVTAIVPYLCYARKDRRSQLRDPVTTRYVAGMFEAVGTDRIVTLDVHNVAAYQNAFRCRTEHLEANELLAASIAPALRDMDVVVVSPDAGGVRRAEDFRQCLGQRIGRDVHAAFAGKLRASGVVTGKPIVGEVAGRCAIIVDDLIGTGTTLSRIATDCLALGAREVRAVATHGLFVGGACELLAGEALAQVVVTDTVPPFRVPSGPLMDKLAVIDTSSLFARAIRCLHTDSSLSNVNNPLSVHVAKALR